MSDHDKRVEEIRKFAGERCAEEAKNSPMMRAIWDLLTAYDEACRQRDAERERAERAERLLAWFEAQGWICDPGCCGDECRCAEVRAIASGKED